MSMLKIIHYPQDDKWPGPTKPGSEHMYSLAGASPRPHDRAAMMILATGEGRTRLGAFVSMLVHLLREG